MIKLRTIISLGVLNVFRVAWYRLVIKIALPPVCQPVVTLPKGPFFVAGEGRNAAGYPQPRDVDGLCYFGWKYQTVDVLPDWFLNPFSGSALSCRQQPWWTIPDFDEATGDIKAVWEASRFDWVVDLANSSVAGEAGSLGKLNSWLADWCVRNPVNQGPNWKCGQEASLRVLHLALASLVMGIHLRPTSDLLALIKAHLQRIEPTIGYACAQNNNHGTSEAAALYVGGAWLESQGDPKGAFWKSKGERLLENRVLALVEKDGTFSQYSLNYHRLFLDTCSFVELWRRAFGLKPFNMVCLQRLAAATRWLFAMVQPETGAVPNLGANDGANFFPLSGADYRDFRPSTHLAAILFNKRLAFESVKQWDCLFHRLDISLPGAEFDPPVSESFDDGGYQLLRARGVFALFNVPQFRFRPSQADLLHVDLWRNGENLLRDGGTFSYAADQATHEYYSGTSSHNTIQFDHRDQMPRLGRFLFGDWVRSKISSPLRQSVDGVSVAASYRDRAGARHQRKLYLSDDLLRVEDDIEGFRQCAVLRWRLAPGEWMLDGVRVTNGIDELLVTCSMPLKRVSLVEGWESLYYHHQTPLPVLEIEVEKPGVIVTEYRFGT